MAEVRTEPLRGDRLQAQLGALCELCTRFEPGELNVSYGWACNLEVDDLWKARSISASSLSSFIDESISNGVFELGESDLHIKGTSVEFEFTLCHESDLHFESPDESLVSLVTEAWGQAGLAFYEVA